MRSTLVVVLLSTLASSAAAGTVTVSPAGPITTLQGGLDAAVPGDTVLVLEGTYNGDFDNTKSSLIVRGVGTVVLNGNGTFTGAKRCVFQNFTINGNASGNAIALHLDQDSHGNVLSGLAVTAAADGILIEGSRNSLLNSTATATDTAVHVGGSFNTVMSCVAGPTTNDDVYRVSGQLNLLRRCSTAGSGDDGFEVNGRAHALVQCTAFGSSAAGFRVSGSGCGLSKCVANTNFESGATLEGNGNTVARSFFGTEGGNAGPGILLDGDGNLVTGCTVSGNAGGGMDLGSGGGNAQLNRLERNRVLANTGHGIFLSSNGATNDNWIERNAVSGNTGDGIRVESDHNVILGNSVSGNGGTALNILGSNNLSLNNKAL